MAFSRLRTRLGLDTAGRRAFRRFFVGLPLVVSLTVGVGAADGIRTATHTIPKACTAQNPGVWLKPLSTGKRFFLRKGAVGFGKGSGAFVCERYAASLGAIALTPLLSSEPPKRADRRPVAATAPPVAAAPPPVAATPQPVAPAPPPVAPAPPPVAALPRPVAAEPPPLPSPNPNYAVKRIYFATDRAAIATGGTVAQFGSARGTALSYGFCDVEVPNDHHPSARTLYDSIVSVIFRPDPNKHMKIDRAVVESDATFDQALSDATRHSTDRQALVFVHGFNVSWNQAIMTTADLAFDLGPTFDGPAISYSWPSRGDTALYTYDQQNASYTAPHLAAFLEEVATKSGATKIHIITHSMGGYALSLALEYLAAHNLPQLKGIHDISLAAPDIDADIFSQQYASMYQRTSTILTLYTSSVDYAMQASRKVNGARRLGDSNNLTFVPGFNVVDATDIDTDFLGHGYFEDQLSMITDFGLNFLGIPEPHPPLQVRRIGSSQYYAFP